MNDIPTASSSRPRVSDSPCCLLFTGEPDASSGSYLPTGYILSLAGGDLAQHQVTHLHEIHHKALNDDTSWGAFLHVAARNPRWQSLLPHFVDACRLVHESFASFMSLSLARARHPDIDRVLTDYPAYRPLADRLTHLLAPIPAGHRRDLAATGVARWCMSAPVLELAIENHPDPLRLSAVPACWRPDHRYRVLLHSISQSSVSCAGATADQVFEQVHGRSVQEIGLDETNALLDSAWTAWEDAFISTLITTSERLSMWPTVTGDEHLEAAERLVELLEQDGLHVGLPHGRDEAPITDIESVRRLTAALSLALRPAHRSAIATIGEGVDLEPVLALCEASSTPFIVLHGRRAGSMLRQFHFDAADTAYLTGTGDRPLFSVRVLIGDDGRDLMLHAELAAPDSFRALESRWGTRGVAATCITASCYLAGRWQGDWLPALRSWPSVVLVDTGLPGMVGFTGLLGTDEPVHGAYLGLAHQTLTALVWHVTGHPHVMLAIADDLTVQLLAGQLTDLLADRLSMSEADWSQWTQVLAAVASSVIGTEAVISFDGAVLP